MCLATAKGVLMSFDNLWQSHDLIPDREVKVGDDVYRHRRCQRCRRDFVIEPEGVEWRAVHPSVFEFVMLDGETNRKWLAEPCPGPRE
jgi:hypothetical protein